METEVDVYDRKRIKGILGRLRKPGGLPWNDKQVEQLTTWFRTLANRGYTKSSFFSDPDNVVTTFEAAFTNPMTRCQYTRALLLYLSGLSDAEYEGEYPNIERRNIASILNDITQRAGIQRRRNKTANAPHSA